jgi:hypothetical protein
VQKEVALALGEEYAWWRYARDRDLPNAYSLKTIDRYLAEYQRLEGEIGALELREEQWYYPEICGEIERTGT